MKEKSLEPTPQRPGGGRSTDARMVVMDLGSSIAQIKQEQAWKSSDRNAITLFKSDHMRIVLTALHEGAALTRHTANGIINVQLLEGKIAFGTDEKSIELSPGQMLTLHETIPHSVEAKEESVFLLTLVPVQS
jgi:quercetin dioxygenase-like cupin family protein